VFSRFLGPWLLLAVFFDCFLQFENIFEPASKRIWRNGADFLIHLPYNSNLKLKSILDRVNGDEYRQSLWECINVNAVRRLGLSDHGPVHFAIVSNIALKILRNLLEAGVKPNIVTDHRMTDDDAEVVVFLGAVLHDLGMVAHRENHHMFS